MLTYSFTDIGSDSLYLHLYKCIKNDIVKGVLAPDTKLPSKRSFAKNLGVSVITVENAYAQLIAEGYIYSVSKKGFFISDIKNIPCRTIVQKKEDSVQIYSETKKYLADFTSNQTNIQNFPFSIWAKLIREVLNESQQELVTNPPCGGILDLRNAIADYLKDFRNLTVSPEQIIIGAGTEYLYSLIIQLLGFDKKYAIEDPGYQKIARIYKKHKVTCSHIPMDLSGICINELEAAKTDIIHITPSHHFPTGLVMPIGRRYELLGWASKSDTRYIIEDDYDSEFRMTGQPIPALQNIDMQEKVIYINTFTKTLASTVRISYMVLPPHLLKRYYSEMSFYSCTVSNFEQYTLSRFIEEGYFEKHINRMRNYYHTKRDFLLHMIQNSRLAPFAEIEEEDAGLHFIMRLKTELTDTCVCQRAENKGIRLSALSSYYNKAENQPEHLFVMNYSSVDESNIQAAVDTLYEIVTISR